MNERVLRLERAIEVALTFGIGGSALLLLAGLVTGLSTPMRIGVLLLMLTPVLRVVVVTIGLLHEKDWLFASLSCFVLAVLTYGVVAAL